VEDLKQYTAKFDIKAYTIVIIDILIQRHVKGTLEKYDSCSLRRGILFIFRQVKLIKSCYITFYIFILDVIVTFDTVHIGRQINIKKVGVGNKNM